MIKIFHHLISLTFIAFGASSAYGQAVDQLSVPEGYSISLYATGLTGVRMIKLTENGDLIISQPDLGKIMLIKHEQPSDPITLLSQLNQPHGVEYHEGWLYVAETDAIGRIRYDAESRYLSSTYQRISPLPGGGNHWQRNLRIGPDGFIYITVGSTCNVCIEKSPQRAAMLRFKPEGGPGEIIATGLRNTEGFDWHPKTHQLYGVDNGRDHLGDDFPPDELNLIEPGKFYGWPFANGDKVQDPDFGAGHERQIQQSIAPIHDFKAHSAPLNLLFLRGKRPEGYQNAALVTLHGSWNRSQKQGYEIVSLHFQADGSILERPFLKGFEQNEKVSGRPVDIVESPDGTLFVSDDFSGSIYKITH